MKGTDMLKEAAGLVAERCKIYGPPARSMELLAKRWSLTLGHSITPAQVLMCLIDLKLTRLAHDPSHKDSVLDIAGYAAVLQEVMQ